MTPFYDARRFDPRDGLGYLVARARRALLEALERELAPLGITAPQAIVIFQVATGEATHAAEFCRNMQYDPGAMTRLLDRMERKGLVRRVRAAHDRRRSRLVLTPQGRRALPRIRSVAVEVFNRFLAGFRREEARQLIDFLKRLIANAEP